MEATDIVARELDMSSGGVGVIGRDVGNANFVGEDGSARADIVGVERRVGVLLRGGGVPGRWQGMRAERGTSEVSVPALGRTPRFCRDLPAPDVRAFFAQSAERMLWSVFSSFSKPRDTF